MNLLSPKDCTVFREGTEMPDFNLVLIMKSQSVVAIGSFVYQGDLFGSFMESTVKNY